MQRRDFLVLGSLIGISPYLQAESIPKQRSHFEKLKKTIAAVQAHMFPEGGRLPSAKAMQTIHFVEDTLFHPTYDKDIRAFVIEGAEELEHREKGRFLSYSSFQKEKALRAYEATDYGSNWLARIMTLSMEAMLSDPIYGSNHKEAGWHALHTKGGEPRPTQRYIGT
jgi:hypothetical protein